MNKITTNIRKIRNISEKMPKSLNEAINFEQPDGHMGRPSEDNPPIKDAEPETAPQHDDMDVMAFVDDIRKKSLKGMAQLADNPDDERYQLLKKIWQICDKRPEQQQLHPQPRREENGGMM